MEKEGNNSRKFRKSSNFLFRWATKWLVNKLSNESLVSGLAEAGRGVLIRRIAPVKAEKNASRAKLGVVKPTLRGMEARRRVNEPEKEPRSGPESGEERTQLVADRFVGRLAVFRGWGGEFLVRTQLKTRARALFRRRRRRQCTMTRFSSAALY